MTCFLLQKRPDGLSNWSDTEGQLYNFARRLPNAKSLCKHDQVLFYRPMKSGTPEDGCIYALARVAGVEMGAGGLVDAMLADYVKFGHPVPLKLVGDPRANAQHSFQRVTPGFYESVLQLAGGLEGQAT